MQEEFTSYSTKLDVDWDLFYNLAKRRGRLITPSPLEELITEDKFSEAQINAVKLFNGDLTMIDDFDDWKQFAELAISANAFSEGYIFNALIGASWAINAAEILLDYYWHNLKVYNFDFEEVLKPCFFYELEQVTFHPDSSLNNLNLEWIYNSISDNIKIPYLNHIIENSIGYNSNMHFALERLQPIPMVRWEQLFTNTNSTLKRRIDYAQYLAPADRRAKILSIVEQNSHRIRLGERWPSEDLITNTFVSSFEDDEILEGFYDLFWDRRKHISVIRVERIIKAVVKNAPEDRKNKFVKRLAEEEDRVGILKAAANYLPPNKLPYLLASKSKSLRKHIEKKLNASRNKA